MHIDDNPVANVNLDSRNRPLPIDSNDWALKSIIGVGSDPANLEIKLSGSCPSQSRKGEKQRCLGRQEIGSHLACEAR